MHKYTVVLLLPDYVAGQYGETYCAQVEAADPRAALQAGQAAAALTQADFAPPRDYLPVFLAAGHHKDLSVTL